MYLILESEDGFHRLGDDQGAERLGRNDFAAFAANRLHDPDDLAVDLDGVQGDITL